MERLSLYEHRFDLQHRHALRDLLRLKEIKTNLKSRTHLTEGNKEFNLPDTAPKPIPDPPETI